MQVKGRRYRLNKPANKGQELDNLIESLIKMIGKSNERVSELNKRVRQLEMFIHEYRLIGSLASAQQEAAAINEMTKIRYD